MELFISGKEILTYNIMIRWIKGLGPFEPSRTAKTVDRRVLLYWVTVLLENGGRGTRTGDSRSQTNFGILEIANRQL